MNACDMEGHAENYFRSMDTNDPRAPYGEPKAEQRAPLLSIKKAIGGHWIVDAMHLVGYNWYAAEADDVNRAEATAEFVNKCIAATIEAKITRGELMVVKTVRMALPFHGEHYGWTWDCLGCGFSCKLNPFSKSASRKKSTAVNFCPGCGAKIIP